VDHHRRPDEQQPRDDVEEADAAFDQGLSAPPRPGQ
jgi:hypothetical protein